MPVRNQLNPFLLENLTRRRQRQDAQLRLPRFTQTRVRLLQVRIVVARMTNELPSALGNSLGNRMEEGFVERPCDLDAQSSVRSDETFLRDRAAERFCEPAQNSQLCVARPQIRTLHQLAGSHRQ